MIGTSENGEIITRFTNSVHTLLPDKGKNEMHIFVHDFMQLGETGLAL